MHASLGPLAVKKGNTVCSKILSFLFLARKQRIISFLTLVRKRFFSNCDWLKNLPLLKITFTCSKNVSCHLVQHDPSRLSLKMIGTGLSMFSWEGTGLSTYSWASLHAFSKKLNAVSVCFSLFFLVSYIVSHTLSFSQLADIFTFAEEKRAEGIFLSHCNY